MAAREPSEGAVNIVGIMSETLLDVFSGRSPYAPLRADEVLRFTVVGKAKTAGSKVAFRSKNSGRIIVKDAADNTSWRSEVTFAAARAMEANGLREPLLGPIGVEFNFYRPRGKGHFGTGRNANVVKPSAPAFPTVAPDVLKLSRLVEDAMSGIVYRDDAQIVDEMLRKRFGDVERVEIVIRSVIGDDNAAVAQPSLLAA